MAKIIETENNVINQIGVGTEITGDVATNGDIRFDGILTGNLKTKGKVVVGETGAVKGEINCKNSVVEGKVEGKIIVGELLTLKATSTLTGDIVTRRLAIEPGAKFSGNCSMSSGNPFQRCRKRIRTNYRRK
jgi:cytoskeletal protein CcmA (bactofilin family)